VSEWSEPVRVKPPSLVLTHIFFPRNNRFDTTTMQKGFTIFSLNCRVDLAFTVVDKDDIGR